MLATPKLILEAAQLSLLEELYPRWIEVPLYRARLPQGENFTRELLSRLPFLTKNEIREGFPRNFLASEAALESLLDRNVVELEHTSGTSGERAPVLLRQGWWDEQEERALRLTPSSLACSMKIQVRGEPLSPRPRAMDGPVPTSGSRSPNARSARHGL